MLPCVAAGASLVLAETCQPGNSPPRFLAAQRSAVSSRREEIAILRWRVNTQGSADPCAIPGGLVLYCLTGRASSTVFASTLFLDCNCKLVCSSYNDQTAEQRTYSLSPPQGIFALQKSLRGGTTVGMGSPAQSGIAAPAQRNFQRKFALRRVGFHKFVVPPTSNRSKVRNNSRLVRCPYRAAPGSLRGSSPSVWERVQRKPFSRVFFGQRLLDGRRRSSLRS